MILGALMIMCMRISDVTFGTLRMILVVQGRKYYAAMAGFCEVLIWIFAMRYIVQHMDHTINLFAYATGYALGNIMGVTIEQKIGMGYVQLNIISRHYADIIADKLRRFQHGVTLLPGEGSAGGVAILVVIIRRKDQKAIIKLIESIDENAFIFVQSSIPYRGYIQGARK